MATKDGTYSTASDREADQARSREDWSKLHVRVLRHKCNSYGLDVTGLKKVLRECLFLYFNPQEAETTETHEASHRPAESKQHHPRKNLPRGGPPATRIHSTSTQYWTTTSAMTTTPFPTAVTADGRGAGTKHQPRTKISSTRPT